MKKIILTVAIVSATVGLSSCGVRESAYSPGYSNYVYSSSYNPNAYRYYSGYRYNRGYYPGYGSGYGLGLGLGGLTNAFLGGGWNNAYYGGGYYGRGWNNAYYGRGWGNRWSNWRGGYRLGHHR